MTSAVNTHIQMEWEHVGNLQANSQWYALLHVNSSETLTFPIAVSLEVLFSKTRKHAKSVGLKKKKAKKIIYIDLKKKLN